MTRSDPAEQDQNQHDDQHQAQTAKLDHICRKLQLKPGEHLLDIGCGWGALVMHAARHCRFVAKAEVRHWPLIGRLATGAGRASCMPIALPRCAFRRCVRAR